eukprot:1181041-Prorocentrum_minimum.AAC.4
MDCCHSGTIFDLPYVYDRESGQMEDNEFSKDWHTFSFSIPVMGPMLRLHTNYIVESPLSGCFLLFGYFCTSRLGNLLVEKLKPDSAFRDCRIGLGQKWNLNKIVRKMQEMKAIMMARLTDKCKQLEEKHPDLVHIRGYCKGGEKNVRNARDMVVFHTSGYLKGGEKNVRKARDMAVFHTRGYLEGGKKNVRNAIKFLRDIIESKAKKL